VKNARDVKKLTCSNGCMAMVLSLRVIAARERERVREVDGEFFSVCGNARCNRERERESCEIIRKCNDDDFDDT
jgi:hypothetical protein